MTVYFDEDGAKVDDQFVHQGDISVRISEIKSITEQEYQPGWFWPIGFMLFGIPYVVVWLPAPIENLFLGVMGFALIAFGVFRHNRMKPKEYWLTLTAGMPVSSLIFKSEDNEKVNFFRKAIEKSMSAASQSPTATKCNSGAAEGAPS